MPNFDFRLKTVLKVREAERQQRRWELAQALEADRILQLQKEAVEKELDSAQRAARNAVNPGVVNVDRLLELRRYVLQLQSQQRTLGQQQEKIRDEIERRRVILVEADRQVRTLENLRERQLDEYRQEEQRLEQKTLDEAFRPDRDTSTTVRGNS